MCVPGRTIVHTIIKPCYATSSGNTKYTDSVDDYGFLLDLKGLKLQVDKWSDKVVKTCNANVETGQQIPLKLFDNLLATLSTAAMWKAAHEIYCLATCKLSHNEEDLVSMMKQEPSGRM